MQSNIAIKHLEQYIQKIKSKKILDKELYEGLDEKIKSAHAQIELYRIGKGRLQNTGISAI